MGQFSCKKEEEEDSLRIAGPQSSQLTDPLWADSWPRRVELVRVTNFHLLKQTTTTTEKKKRKKR